MEFWYKRTLCDVLEEMRILNKKRNYSYLDSLIEEAQMMGNRMESGLDGVKNLATLEEKVRALKKEKKALEKELESLKERKNKLSSFFNYLNYDLTIRYQAS